MPIQRVSKQYKQLQKDIEAQVRKRIEDAEEEETYVDKARGISVVLEAEGGGADLKGDFKNTGVGEFEDESTIPYVLYLKQAEHFLVKDLAFKALDRLNIALKIEPESLVVLCTRSKCHLKLGQWKEALRDAEAVLARKPEYVKAIFCKSEALYNLCKFEYALLGYLKGSRLVPDSEAFKLGHIKCKKTINNSLTSDMFCVEDSRVVRFLDNFDMNSLYGGNVVKEKAPSFLKKTHTTATSRGPETRKANINDIKTSRLKEDYNFFKKLEFSLEIDFHKKNKAKKNEPDESENFEDHTEEVLDMVKKGIDYLDHRADFWTNMK